MDVVHRGPLSCTDRPGGIGGHMGHAGVRGSRPLHLIGFAVIVTALALFIALTPQPAHAARSISTAASPCGLRDLSRQRAHLVDADERALLRLSRRLQGVPAGSDLLDVPRARSGHGRGARRRGVHVGVSLARRVDRHSRGPSGPLQRLLLMPSRHGISF